jgi:hypothetical protein
MTGRHALVLSQRFCFRECLMALGPRRCHFRCTTLLLRLKLRALGVDAEEVVSQTADFSVESHEMQAMHRFLEIEPAALGAQPIALVEELLQARQAPDQLLGEIPHALSPTGAGYFSCAARVQGNMDGGNVKEWRAF